MTQPRISLQLSNIIQSIKEASSYTDVQEIANRIITVDKLHQIELVKKLEVYLVDPQGLIPIQLKINIFETMAALLFTDQKDRFLKHFVTRIYYFLNKCSVIISDSKQKSQRIMEIFKKWENAKIFSTSFYNKLRDLANSIFYLNVQQKAPVFKKYSKHFLIEYRDTWKVELTKILYDSHQIKISGQEDFKILKQQIASLCKSKQQEIETRQKAADLKMKVQLTIEKLMKSLKLNKKGAILLQQLLYKQKEGLDIYTKQEYISGHA